MKFFPAKKPSPTAAEPPVVFAPGDHFLVRRFDLPAGMPASEIAGFVTLQLEELSPFPLEQLYHGQLIASDGSAVLVYAAYRRRFDPEHTERWARALFVMPDFAPALRLRYERPTVVLFRSEAAMTALQFDGARELPERVVSRPVPMDAGDDEVAAVRERLLASLGVSGLPIRDVRLTSAPEQRTPGMTFVLGPDTGEGSASEIVIPMAQCWGMDIREAEFVAQQRRRLGFDLVLWRIVLGSAAALALLVLGELLLLGGRGYTAWLEGRTEQRAPLVAELEDKHTVASRLADFGKSGLSPFAMIGTVWGPKPESIYFTRVKAVGVNRLEIEATTQNLADMNAYEAALRNLPELESVEVRNPTTREEGTTFSVIVAFKAGSLDLAPADAANVADTGASP